MGSGGQQPLVLALLPVERLDADAVEPRVHCSAKRGLAPEPSGERELAEIDGEAPAQHLQRLQLVQLAKSVRAVAAARAGRDDQARAFEVAEHPRRPAGPARGFSDRQPIHGSNLTTT